MKLKNIIIYGLIIFGLVSGVWWFANKIASVLENIDVVEVEPGIKCAVVSRAFNTSIDCWEHKPDDRNTNKGEN